jgi:hypothetical protein
MRCKCLPAPVLARHPAQAASFLGSCSHLPPVQMAGAIMRAKIRLVPCLPMSMEEFQDIIALQSCVVLRSIDHTFDAAIHYLKKSSKRVEGIKLLHQVLAEIIIDSSPLYTV